jgi:hypothetical protein
MEASVRLPSPRIAQPNTTSGFVLRLVIAALSRLSLAGNDIVAGSPENYPVMNNTQRQPLARRQWLSQLLRL